MSKEYYAEYRIKNREKIYAIQRKYYDKNKQLTIDRSKQWKKDNPDKVKISAATYRKNNYFFCKASSISKYSKNYISPELVQIVYEDNIKKHGTLTCYICLNKILFGKDCIEHKIPISRGGSNNYNNIEIACKSCNSKKYNKTISEYLKVVKHDK